MQKIVMVRPDWDKGIVEKFLVCTLSLDSVVKIHPFDPEHLSHIQYAEPGNHLIRIRHHLATNTLSEDIFLISYPKPITVNSKAKIGKEVQEHLQALRSKEHKLFSIFRGVDMTPDEFDCPVRTVRRLLAPLKKADAEMYAFICQELEFSKASDCVTTWSTAGKKPKWLNTRERLVTDAAGDSVIHTSEHWLLIHADGEATMPDLEPTRGAHVDHETQRTLKTYNAPPMPIPDTVVKAVKITIGVNDVDGVLRGVALKMYRN